MMTRCRWMVGECTENDTDLLFDEGKLSQYHIPVQTDSNGKNLTSISFAIFIETTLRTPGIFTEISAGRLRLDKEKSDKMDALDALDICHNELHLGREWRGYLWWLFEIL